MKCSTSKIGIFQTTNQNSKSKDRQHNGQNKKDKTQICSTIYPVSFTQEKFRLNNLNPRKLRISMSYLFRCEIITLETNDWLSQVYNHKNTISIISPIDICCTPILCHPRSNLNVGVI